MLFPITKSTINKKKKINDTESNFASNDIIIGAYRSLQSSHFLIPRNTYMLTAVNFESLQHHERNYLLYGLVYAYLPGSHFHHYSVTTKVWSIPNSLDQEL
jgi:hypothetical protein